MHTITNLIASRVLGFQSSVSSDIQHRTVSVDGLLYESVTIHGVAERPAVVLVNDVEHGAVTFQWEHQVNLWLTLT